MSMTADFSILVVVYKKDWRSSSTLIHLSQFGPRLKERLELVIFDNSPTTAIAISHAEANGFSETKLFHDGKNHFLGEIYRRFVEVSRGRHLVFMDDDTAITEEYILEVERLLQKPMHSYSICVPQIFDSHGNIYSPSKFGVFSGQLLREINPGPHKNLNAIMSGIAFNRSYYSKLGRNAFSTKTRLYGVDTMLMERHNLLGNTVLVTSMRFEHSFSHDQQRTVIESIRRSALEAQGVFWTVVGFRKRWLLLLPLYIFYFMLVRLLRAGLTAK